MHRAIGWVVGLFMVYGLGAYGLLHLLNQGVPAGVENAIVLLAMPLQLLCLPWMGVLHLLGLTEGEWVRAPSLGGVVLILMVYASILYGVLWGALTVWRRYR